MGWPYHCVTKGCGMRVLAEGRLCSRCNPQKSKYKLSPEQKKRHAEKAKEKRRRQRANGIPSIWGSV